MMFFVIELMNNCLSVAMNCFDLHCPNLGHVLVLNLAGHYLCNHILGSYMLCQY